MNKIKAESGFDEDGETFEIKNLNPQELNTEIKRLTKSARNRVYAQTSRARHRLYVKNLENDRKLLVERLERIEAYNKRIEEDNKRIREDNKKMKKELCEIKSEISSRSLKLSEISSRSLNSSINQSNISDQLFPYSESKSFISIPVTVDLNSNYAFSVLDLIILHLKYKYFKKPAQMTNSPRPSSSNLNSLVSRNFIAKLFYFLVEVVGGGCGGGMNWNGSNLKFCNNRSPKTGTGTGMKSYYQLKGKGSLRMMSSLEKLKSAQLRIYLQQFGSNELFI